MVEYICNKCRKVFSALENKYKCPCGGLFSLNYKAKPIDFGNLGAEFSMWRYCGSMPFKDLEFPRKVTMGEGFTPLIRLNPENENLLLKCDYYMPTLSFKDRGAAVLIAAGKAMGVKRILCDSSGNAGTAIAAYSARAGFPCDVFVPDATSDKKIQQIRAHGAVVHKIPGSREDTANAAIQTAETSGAFYASHIFNPLFYEGTKTYFFEVFEQMGGKMPDAFIIPAGNGTLLFGAKKAFEQLAEWGYMNKTPRILAVQAENCAPLYNAFVKGEKTVSPVQNEGTLAEGIAIAAPARGSEMLEAIRVTGGDVVCVSDEETLAARGEMSAYGIYVEITSAVNYAGYKRFVEKYPELAELAVVMPLCGAGIKSS